MPDPIDTAIIPDSFSGNVVVNGLADVATLYVGSGSVEVNGSLFAAGAGGLGSIDVLGNATFAGDVDSLSLGSYGGGSITFDTGAGDITLFDPSISLQGGSSVTVSGGGTVTMTSGTLLDLQSGTLLDVTDASTLDIEADWDIDADVYVGAGSLIRHLGSFGSLTSLGSYTFEIAGDSTSTANYGQVDWGSTATSIEGTIFESLVGYTPVPGDLYDVVLCGAGGCDAGAFDATGPSLTAIFSPNDISLAGVSTDITVDTLADTIAPGECSLRAAVTAANTDAVSGGCPAGSGADTIVFGVSGTIPLGAPLDPIDTDVIIDGQGQDITISGRNSTSIMSVDVGGSRRSARADDRRRRGPRLLRTDHMWCRAERGHPQRGLGHVLGQQRRGNGAAITNDRAASSTSPTARSSTTLSDRTAGRSGTRTATSTSPTRRSTTTSAPSAERSTTTAAARRRP